MSEKRRSNQKWSWGRGPHGELVLIDDQGVVVLRTSDSPTHEHSILLSAAPELLEGCELAADALDILEHALQESGLPGAATVGNIKAHLTELISRI
jgi:hypothetical protein